MWNRRRTAGGSRSIALMMAVLVCALTPAAWADLSVYRALSSKGVTCAKADTSPSQFRFDDEDGMSTFELPNVPTGKPCKLQFILTGATSKPAKGTTAPVKDLPDYQATYTPQYGDGHWSIDTRPGVLKTKEEKKKDMSTYAKRFPERITPNDAFMRRRVQAVTASPARPAQSTPAAKAPMAMPPAAAVRTPAAAPPTP